MKEKKTRAGLRLLLTAENVKNVNRAYEVLRAVVPRVDKGGALTSLK
jgi:transcription-repair coupling factor (superfamily II helicase)